MAIRTLHSSRPAWELAARQHWVVTRAQLLSLGFPVSAIVHRLGNGRLHATASRAVYAVGGPIRSRDGLLMAAVLACGAGTCLSHPTAVEHWGMLAPGEPSVSGPIHITIPAGRRIERPGIKVHRRDLDPTDILLHRQIPVTSPVQTLIDFAATAAGHEVEAAINGADRLDRVTPNALRRALDDRSGQHGVPALRKLLDHRTFALTDSVLERRFIPLALEAGLPKPLTQRYVNGFRVDFYWPQLGLVVETDGLRYHRTATQQSRDRRRDQAHAAAGLTSLRFTHSQIAHSPAEVVATLAAVARRLVPG